MENIEPLDRIAFFNQFFKKLEERGIAYTVLHSYENFPEETPSDVDYCVGSGDLNKIPKILRDLCHLSGWRLVQILQHEYCAYYCVCISVKNPRDFLLLDAASHYVREGRLLIRDSDLLKGAWRHPVKGFFIPARNVEVGYILWKAAAKNKNISSLSERLSVLGVEGGGSNLTNDQLRAICEISGTEMSSGAVDDVHRLLLARYGKLPSQSRLSQLKKLINRIIRPTGCLCLVDAESDVGEILESVRPAFRKVVSARTVRIVDWELLVRSTLIMTDRAPFILMVLARLGRCFTRISTHEKKPPQDDLLEWMDDRVARQWSLE